MPEAASTTRAGEGASATRAAFARAVQDAIDHKTKPLGSLGRLEALAAQLAEVQQTLKPTAERCRLTVFAADHGIAQAGVSAFPQAVTRQMLRNFLASGAAANVMAKALGVEFNLVDAGVAGRPLRQAGLASIRIGNGTRNSVEQPAMTAAQCRRALQEGRAIGNKPGFEVACFGEMGIGNTSSASLVSAKLLGLPVGELTGRGTGLDDARLARKRGILETAAARMPAELGPDSALREYGGFETVMLAGAMMGAAEAGKLVLVDGFIATASALAARRLMPDIARHFVFAHRSAEPGHSVLLEAMDAEPLLDLRMRLGEGTGALLAWPLVQAAAAMLREMASFRSANVTEKS